MFGFLEDAFDSAAKKAEDFVSDPVGETVKAVTQPARDALEVVDGLTEGELRTKAAIRLGADVAGGMALSELIDWYNDA